MAKTKVKSTVEEQILEAQKAEKEYETCIEVIKPTVEEQILGATDEIKKVKVFDYLALKRRYKVHNVKKGRIYELNGYEIGAILGLNNDVRNELKQGAPKVEIKEFNDDLKDYELLYKIEVIK